MTRKFNIDKRLITLSAQILNGEISRDNALREISMPPYDNGTIEETISYVLKKLDLSETEFNDILQQENKFYWDYPSYMPLINNYNVTLRKIAKYFLPYTPTILVEKSVRG